MSFSDKYLNKNKARCLLGLSNNDFEKAVKLGHIEAVIMAGKKFYLKDDILRILRTKDKYQLKTKKIMNIDKEFSKVYQTMNYDKFKTLLGNRHVKEIQIARLERSFNEQYLISPIIVNDKFEIIDGQHRFNAARNLKLPIRYIIAENYSLEEVKVLNTLQKNWNKADYLDAYCELGFKEYLRLKQFRENFPEFSIAICEMLLTNSTNDADKKENLFYSGGKVKSKNSSGVAKRSFINGEFKVNDYETAVENAKKILQIKPFYKGFSRAKFVGAMTALFNIAYYDHSRFIRRLEVNPNALRHCTSIYEYRALIEEIYNFRSQDKVPLRYEVKGVKS